MPHPKLTSERQRILRQYFEDLSAVLAEEGLGSVYGPLLAELGLGPEAFLEPGGNLTFEHYLAALQALDRDGRIQGLGLKLGAKKGHRTFGFAGIAALTQGSLAKAHDFAVLSFELYWGQLLRLEGRMEEGWIVGRYHATPAALAYQPTLLEQAAMTGVRLISETLPGMDWSACKAKFAFPAPPHAELYARFLPLGFAFGQPHNELWFPSSWSDLPSALGDEHIKEFCELGFHAMLEEGKGPQDCTHRVRTLLMDAEPGHWPGLPDLAQRLGLTERSLRAQLFKEGSSFRTLVNEAVMAHARALLGDPRLTNKEVAWRLGFAQPPSFFRAFTKATGLTPEQYRARLQAGPKHP